MSKKEKDKKTSCMGAVLTIVIYFIIGGICGIFMGKYMHEIGADADNPGEFIVHVVITLLALYISIFVHIILHEGGHLVFGLMTGYKFSSFRIGSFMWIRKDDRIVLKKFSLAGTGGQCLMAPPDMSGEEYPFFWYNMGGCVSNIVFAGAAMGLSFLCADIGMLSLILKVFAVVGFALALINGIPVGLSGVDNDGSNTVSISRSVKSRKAFWLMMKINEQASSGVRIKDMPDSWFVMPDIDDMNNTMVSSTAVFKCNRLMDELKLEEARTLMEKIVDNKKVKLNGVYRNLLKLDMLFCELVGENNAECVDRLLNDEQKKFMKMMKRFPSVLRTGYAYFLFAKRDETEAAKVLGLFDKMAETYPNKVDIDSERELIEYAEKKWTE